MRRSRCRGPVWCSKVGSRSKPRARWHSVAHWFSRSRLTTIAPNCSLSSYAPTPSRPTAGLCRRGRRLIDATPGPSRPRRYAPFYSPAQHSPALVACVTAYRPARCWLGLGMNMSLFDNAVCADDQQTSEGPLAHLRRGSEPLFAACRMLTGHQTQPGSKMPGLAETVWWWRKGRYGRGNQRARADARHRYQASCHVVLLGATGDLGIELADLCLQLPQCRDQNLEGRNGVGRQIAS